VKQKKISYEDYKDKSTSNETYTFYTGNNEEEIETLKKIAEDYKIKMYYIDQESLNEKEKEELKKKSSLYTTTDGKETFSYKGNYKEYQIIKSLMNQNIIEDDYIEIDINDYLSIVKEKGYQFIFIGSSSCGYCTNFKPEIKAALQEYNANIYYLDVSKLSNVELQQLYSSDKYFTENEWGTPLNLLFKDGKRINVLNGYVPKDELVNFLKKNKVI